MGIKYKELRQRNSIKERIKWWMSEASTVIADGVTELSANSQEVASATTEGTQVMIQAVDSMNRVKETLNEIYNLAQNLRNEYNV